MSLFEPLINKLIGFTLSFYRVSPNFVSIHYLATSDRPLQPLGQPLSDIS